MVYAPTLLTSLGILGTFVGIVSGLLNFDIDHIDSSISELLAGMKSAFSTSVMGVSLSILLKILYTSSSRQKKGKEQEKPMDIEGVVNNFYQQTEYLKEQSEKTTALDKNIQSMTKMLGSESEGSLLGQIKLLRSDLSDNQKALKQTFEAMTKIMSEEVASPLNNIQQQLENNKTTFNDFETKLWIKLQDFADMMSKSATEAVIEALKKVIQDFNHNLTEQFGENFKQLNVAVMKLIDWQENYKNQLNEMIALYNAGVQSLNVTETSIGKIEHSAQAIPTSMEKLNTIIEVNQNQMNNLESHLNTFAQLRDKAVEAIPEVQQQITTMLENVTKGNEELTKGLATGSEKLQKNLEMAGQELNAGIKASSEALNTHIKEQSQSLANGLNESGQVLMTSVVNTATAFNTHTSQMNQTLEHSGGILANTAETLIKQHKELAENQQKLIERWQNDFNANVKQLQENFNTSVQDMIKTQVSESRNLMQTLEKESENALKSTGESVKKQLDMIDKSMQEEVNRVMNEMGRALATISTKFTSDYAELTKEMAKIVQQNNSRRF